MRTHYKTKFALRTSAILLALRLYAVDHSENLPATLGELVPKYLPSVPADPIAQNAPPMGYQTSPTDPYLFSQATKIGGSKILGGFSARELIVKYKPAPTDPKNAE